MGAAQCTQARAAIRSGWKPQNAPSDRPPGSSSTNTTAPAARRRWAVRVATCSSDVIRAMNGSSSGESSRGAGSASRTAAVTRAGTRTTITRQRGRGDRKPPGACSRVEGAGSVGMPGP